MKYKPIILFAFLFIVLRLSAQDFEIVKVESLPADMSARSEMKTDHNDRQCALLRIASQNIASNQRDSFSFEPDLGSEVVERATRDGEIWLWVSPGLKYLRVKHRDWGQYELRLPDYVTRIEALHTYKVTIKGTLSLASQEQSNNSLSQQYLVFQLSPTNAMLEVDGQLWEVGPDGTAMKFVNFGTYSYRVQAPNYLPETGKVTVDDPINTKTVNVKLKSDFVEVTFQVDADAEIWLNNEKKGIRTWKGQLGKGTYRIECKQANHETSVISKEITAETDRQTITLPAPKPIYGSLSIESTPNIAKVYLDGKDIGETPKYIPEIIIGIHELRITKQCYSDHNETVTIEKGERKLIKADISIPYKGFAITENDLYYKFHNQTNGQMPQIGELMDLAIRCTVNDTIIIIRDTVNTLQMQAPLFIGDIYEGMAMMHKGDSASFIVNIDSTFIKWFQQPRLPEEFKSTDVMRFEVRLDDIYPESEYASRFAIKNNKMIEARIKKLKSDHPEETITAARQLDNYLKKNGITKAPTKSGLYYVMTKKGNGEKPKVGQKVKVHYTGKLLDGTVFDSSIERGDYFEFPLGVGQVIPGFDEGIQLMSKGEKCVLYIPYFLAYGDREIGDIITPFSNLIFEVELIDFEDYEQN